MHHPATNRPLFTTGSSLVLASASPRRRQMLAGLGIRFTVHTADVDERPREGETPAAYVERLAASKAETVAQRYPDHWVLAADTVVVRGSTLLGKPADAAAARAMLAELAGRRHDVFTGVCLRHRRRRSCHRFHCRTGVWFHDLDSRLIAAYVATGEPLDKAGGYGIQGMGGCLVERIEGSYTNVVGLPLGQTVAVLQRAGVITPAGEATGSP